MKKKAERAKQASKLLRNLYKSLYSDAKDRNPRPVQGTCEWFTGHDRFQGWRDGKTCGLLWVSADPGCGKSVLSRYLVDDVLKSSSSSTTCYFFFKDDFEDQRSAAGALCCLLRQIFKEKPALLQDSILKQYDEDGNKLLDSFHELWRLLVSVSTHRGRGQIVCILDALDECEEKDRRLLVETLNEFYLKMDTHTNLKFLVTSRPYVSIERGFHVIQTKLPVIHLRGEGQSESDKIAREIDLVVEARITQLCGKLHLREPEEEAMRQELKKRPNRTYLWVYLVFEGLESCIGHSSAQIEEHIRNIPATVDDAYEKILSRSLDKKKARKLLHMVVVAKRPLKLKEMAVAMTIERNHTSYSQLNIGPEERLRTWVRELCGLFVSIIDDKVYLLHQTAAEFLVEKAGDEDAWCVLLEEDNSRSEWKCSFSPGSSHLTLGLVCAQLLLFTDVVDDVGNHLDAKPRITIESLDPLDKKYPLFTYSVDYWADHLGDASVDGDLPWNNMLQLCSGSESACLVGRADADYYVHAKSLTPLITASILGLAAVTRHLLKLESTDANERDTFHRLPPLLWAVKAGRKAGRKAVFDTFIEIEERHQQRSHLLKRLFGRCYVDFDVKDEHWGASRTPLGWAVRYGEEYIVEKLLATGRVTVFKENLFDAVQKDHADILGALLATRQVKVLCTYRGKRLLSWAVEHRAARSTKYLLDTGKFDIGAELETWTDELPGLAYAAMNGADELLRLLLATGKVEIDFRNDASRGRTALSLASEAGAQECVGLLLATGNVEVNAKDRKGRTPLSYAAEGGHEGVLRLLLATDKILVDIKDGEGLTPLLYAIQGGHEGIVHQLLAADKGIINTIDFKERTPLSYAVEGGHEGIVQQLLTTGKVIIDSRDWKGRTPLLYAAGGGYDRIARQLLDMKADVNAKNEDGRTPFLSAVNCGRESFVGEFLAVDDVDVNTKDGSGHTPLTLAVRRRFSEVVKRLLDTGKVDVNMSDGEGYTPLELAIKGRDLNIVNALLETREVIITQKCRDFQELWKWGGHTWDRSEVDQFSNVLKAYKDK